MAVGVAYKLTGRCSHHRWVRWEKKGAAMGPIKVGLRSPRSDDFCSVCKQPRSSIEGVSA